MPSLELKIVALPWLKICSRVRAQIRLMACNFQMKSCTASKDDGQLSKLVGNSNYMFCRALFRGGGGGVGGMGRSSGFRGEGFQWKGLFRSRIVCDRVRWA